jgi:hypothetical protein
METKFALFIQNYLGDLIREDLPGGTCSMHRVIKMRVQIYSENLKEKYRLASNVNKIVSVPN